MRLTPAFPTDREESDMVSTNPYASPKSDLTQPLGEGRDTTHPFDPSGRFTRLSWLAWTLILGVLSTAILLALMGLGVWSASESPEMPVMPPIAVLALQLASLVAYLLLSIRRFHDMNASGWWSALLVLPLANLVAVLVLALKRGSESANRFGPLRPTPGWERVVGILAVVLLVVGLVGGILAAIAIPAYMDYAQRAAVSG